MNRLFLFCLCVLSSLNLSATRIDLGNDNIFIGDTLASGDNLLMKGTIYSNDFTKHHGIYSEEFASLLTICEYPDKGIFRYDSLYNNNRVNPYFTIFKPGQLYMEGLKSFPLRHYDFEKGRWATHDYVYDDEKISSVDDVDFTGRIALGGLKYFLIPGILLICVMALGSMVPFKIKVPPFVENILPLCVFILLVLGMMIIPDTIIYGLFPPLICGLIIVLLTSICRNQILKNAGRIVAVITFTVMAGRQVLWTTDRVELADGTTVTLKWERGIDLFRRKAISNAISKLNIIPGTERYIARTELLEFEKDAVMGSCVWGLSFVFRPNNVAEDLSYYEARLILRRLTEITGIDNFTVPTWDDWESAISSRIIQRKPDSGLEWTSTPKIVYFPDRSGEMHQSYSHAILAGDIGREGDYLQKSDYKSIYFNHSMRLAYSPKGKPRNSVVRMQLQNESLSANYPQNGFLMGINDVDVYGMDWDDVEEILITKSCEQRRYQIAEIKSNGELADKKPYTIAPNTEPYDFYPVNMPSVSDEEED